MGRTGVEANGKKAQNVLVPCHGDDKLIRLFGTKLQILLCLKGREIIEAIKQYRHSGRERRSPGDGDVEAPARPPAPQLVSPRWGCFSRADGSLWLTDHFQMYRGKAHRTEKKKSPVHYL